MEKGSIDSTVPVCQARTVVGKYELGKYLGGGTFARVKYAKNIETGEGVAIKILDKEKIFELNMTEQINREISIMKLLQHPNVVQLHEVIDSKTKIYLVMEYVTGGELFDKIHHEGRLSEEQARKYFQQLMDAIDYCHSKGICHRDIKLENLLLDSKGVLKIIDFGLSALPQQCKKDGLLHTACGTPNYVAPEVLKNKGYDGAKADIWSCGVILFVLMAGYLPFEDPNLHSLYNKICNAEFVSPPWFTVGARQLLSRILDPNPEMRIRIHELIDNVWFQKNNKCFVNEKKRELQPVTMNAFKLIATSELNLFENRPIKRETTICPARETEEIAKPLLVLEKNYKMKGRKGRVKELFSNFFRKFF